MIWHKLRILSFVLIVATSVVVLGYSSGGHAELDARVVRVEEQIGDPNLVIVTIEVTNTGSGLVWLGEHQKQQVKVDNEWHAPEKLDGLSSFVMQARTNCQFAVTMPGQARTFRLWLSYGDTPQRTRWAWFCSKHDWICGKAPKLCFWVGQRLHKEPEWRSRLVELILPAHTQSLPRSAKEVHVNGEASLSRTGNDRVTENK